VNQEELSKYFAKIGKQGGEARTSKLTPEQRIAAAKKAAAARWAKAKATKSKP
jgi:hypothetical protein